MWNKTNQKQKISYENEIKHRTRREKRHEAIQLTTTCSSHMWLFTRRTYITHALLECQRFRVLSISTALIVRYQDLSGSILFFVSSVVHSLFYSRFFLFRRCYCKNAFFIQCASLFYAFYTECGWQEERSSSVVANVIRLVAAHHNAIGHQATFLSLILFYFFRSFRFFSYSRLCNVAVKHIHV